MTDTIKDSNNRDDCSRSHDLDGSRSMSVELDRFGKAQITATIPTEKGSQSESMRVTIAEAKELFRKLEGFLAENSEL